MNSLGNFLWKIFSVTMVFFCHMGVSYADGNDQCQGNTCITYDNDPKVRLLPEESSTDRQKTICKSGKYLAKCGSYTVGTNWLFGMSKLTDLLDPHEDLPVATPNYFSYNKSNSDTVNMENLRKFFNGTETIVYYPQTSEESSSEQTIKIENASSYIPYRDIILSNVCTNDKGEVSDIQCSACPNNANVSASTVDINYDSGKIIPTSWKIHTIADCYMREFSDETGEYVYTATNVDNDATINCYYTTNVSGSYLPKTGNSNTTNDSGTENTENTRATTQQQTTETNQ